MRILIAGAAGSIGREVARGLSANGHELRGLDLVESPAEHCTLGTVVGDCTDAAVVGEAVDGVEAVVHLAGRPSEATVPGGFTSLVVTKAHRVEEIVAVGEH